MIYLTFSVFKEIYFDLILISSKMVVSLVLLLDLSHQEKSCSMSALIVCLAPQLVYFLVSRYILRSF